MNQKALELARQICIVNSTGYSQTTKMAEMIDEAFFSRSLLNDPDEETLEVLIQQIRHRSTYGDGTKQIAKDCLAALAGHLTKGTEQ